MHGRDGWVLEEFDWDPDTGKAVFRYERIEPVTRELEETIYESLQPTDPKHDGWYTSESVRRLKGF